VRFLPRIKELINNRKSTGTKYLFRNTGIYQETTEIQHQATPQTRIATGYRLLRVYVSLLCHRACKQEGIGGVLKNELSYELSFKKTTD
jgi:hypothetical protein